MKVSVITAVYNNSRTINDVIDSVISQHYQEIEYIIVDGNSTDGTLNIIKKRQNDINVIISEPDGGIYDAINKGIKVATGDIVGIINSDDLFADNNVINRVVNAFNETPEIDAVYADVVFVDQTNKKTVRYYSSKFFRNWMFRFGFQPAHPTFYTRRELFEKLGYYRTDLKISGDFELLLRFMLIGKIKYKYINDVWVKMRIGGVSTSGIKSVLLLNKEILIACKNNNIYSNIIFIYSKYLFKWRSFFTSHK